MQDSGPFISAWFVLTPKQQGPCAALSEAALYAGHTAWSTFPTRHRMLSTTCTHAQPWPAMPLPLPLLFNKAACSASARSLSPSTHATCSGHALSGQRSAGPSGKDKPVSK